jgi:hypothetical protein
MNMSGNEAGKRAIAHDVAAYEFEGKTNFHMEPSLRVREAAYAGFEIGFDLGYEAGCASQSAGVTALREQLAASEARAGKVWDYVTRPLTWAESLSRDFAGNVTPALVDRDEIMALMLNVSPSMALEEVKADVRAAALKEAGEMVLDMENPRVDPSWGTVVRKLDVLDAIRALRHAQKNE